MREGMIRREFWMEASREYSVLAQQDGIAIKGRKDVDVIGNRYDLGRPDENGFAVGKAALPLDLRDCGMHLPPVTIAMHRYVEEP